MKKIKPPKKYGLDNISVKEIVNKYPDKVVDVQHQDKCTSIFIPNGKIIFDSRIKRKPTDKNIAKVLRNNKNN